MMQFFKLLPLPYQVGAIVAIMSILGIVYGLWHHGIYEQGYQACRAEQQEAIKNGEKIYEKTAIKVQRMGDAALRREFCGWVRDSDLPTCLKDLAPFR